LDKKTILSLSVLFLILAGALLALFWPRSGDAHILRISRDGEIIREIDLEGVEASYTLTLEDDSGVNEIEISPDGVRVLSADCPDQVCVRSGLLTEGGKAIICLPHKLVLELTEGH